MKLSFFYAGTAPSAVRGLCRALALTGTLIMVIIAVCRTSVPMPVFCAAGPDVSVPVIDAGHGGPDGGAVSRAGDRESDLNLDIALKMDLIFRLYGIPSYMTRREDVSLHSPDAETLREKKNSDLKNRAGMVNSLKNVTLISIHQNSFTDSRYRGAQVFFSANPESRLLAQMIQEDLRSCLDRENTRQPAKSDAYLLENVTCPAVMVECGFLSNTEETALLTQERYRIRVAAGIVAAYLRYSGGGKAQELEME